MTSTTPSTTANPYQRDRTAIRAPSTANATGTSKIVKRDFPEHGYVEDKERCESNLYPVDGFEEVAYLVVHTCIAEQDYTVKG